LGYKNIKNIPDLIGNLTDLQKLSLANNEITIFQIQLVNLFNLQKLYLKNNKINILQNQILKIKNISYR
jgi:Leucine-rich repeat (LRR) protein